MGIESGRVEGFSRSDTGVYWLHFSKGTVRAEGVDTDLGVAYVDRGLVESTKFGPLVQKAAEVEPGGMIISEQTHRPEYRVPVPIPGRGISPTSK